MKVRLDYVSNSSSSSFMLVGQAFESDEVLKAWQRLHPEEAKSTGEEPDEHEEESDEYEDDYDEYDIVEKLSNELGLEYELGINDYYEMWVIGLPFEKMGDDETKKQFKDRISRCLQKAFPNANAEAIVDGGYEG